MRRRKRGMMRERVALVASSAFVLAALTLTGIYMRKKNIADEEDYLAKLQSVEESTIEVLDQAAKGNLGSMTDQNSFNALFENDMDYMPPDEEISETGSGTVELGNKENTLSDAVDMIGEATRADEVTSNETVKNPLQNEGILDEEGILGDEVAGEEIIDETLISGTPNGDENIVEEISGEETVAEIVPVNEETPVIQEIPQKTLMFDEHLIRPVNGTVLIPYNMSASVYFPTLAHYSYNPAQIISAELGEDVKACANGQVKEIYQDAVLGEVLVLELGGGYEAVYGQLCNISVAVGEYVNEGQIIAKVQSPTYFYSAEGSNLYFQLKAGEESLNPEAYY